MESNEKPKPIESDINKEEVETAKEDKTAIKAKAER